jgi:hypothetical protein
MDLYGSVRWWISALSRSAMGAPRRSRVDLAESRVLGNIITAASVG